MKNTIDEHMKELTIKFGLTVREEEAIRSKFLEIYEEAYLDGRDSIEERFVSYGKREDWK